jgi:hypothetical protein
VRRECRAVGPIARHRIERIGDCHDAGCERDLLGAESIRVSAPVRPFVVPPHHRKDEGVIAQHGLEDASPDDCVLEHAAAFLRGERAGLVQQLIRHADLADVMQFGSEGDLLSDYAALA